MLGKGNAYLENEVVEHLNIQPNHKVLEVGFGTGVGIRAALKKVENGHGRVYGVDISEQMVRPHKIMFSFSNHNVTKSRGYTQCDWKGWY